MRDRGQRNLADAAAGQFVEDDALLTRLGHLGQSRNGLTLENVPGRDQDPAALARVTSWMDMIAVAAEGEERVVDADRVEAQDLREQVGEDTFRARSDRAAAGAVAARPKSGSGSAFRSSLPFTVSGSRSSTTNAAGTMCGGQLGARRIDEHACGSGRGAGLAAPRSPTSRCATDRSSLARSPRPARPPWYAQQRRLDLAELDAEARGP